MHLSFWTVLNVPCNIFLTLYSWLFIFITPYIYRLLFTVASGVTCQCSQLQASFALLYVAPWLCYISLSLCAWLSYSSIFFTWPDMELQENAQSIKHKGCLRVTYRKKIKQRTAYSHLILWMLLFSTNTKLSFHLALKCILAGKRFHIMGCI